MPHFYTVDNAPVVIKLHIITALFAVFLGVLVFLRRKGNVTHKWLGRVWVLCMMMTVLSSFWIQARDRLSLIHVLSVLVLFSMGYAIYAIRNGKVSAHKKSMIFSFAGLIVAGIFTLLPYRMMGQLVFG